MFVFIDFGLDFGSPGGVKNLDSQRFSALRGVLVPTWPQDHPRTLPRPPQTSPKTAQTPPKTPPGLPRTLPGTPPETPKNRFSRILPSNLVDFGSRQQCKLPLRPMFTDLGTQLGGCSVPARVYAAIASHSHMQTLTASEVEDGYVKRSSSAQSGRRVPRRALNFH